MTGENIVVDVSPGGNVKIEANGFTGGACEKATEQLEIVLGGGTAKKKRDYKPEFSMPASTNQTQHQTF